MTNKELEDYIYAYKTFSEYGLTHAEQKAVVKKFGYDEDEYWSKLGVNTCMMDGGETITYHVDVLRTLILLSEDRDMNVFEWD